MAEGVRIQHPTARSVTFSVTDGNRPYRVPLACGASIVVAGELRPCGRIHTFKTYHLNLDETGAVIVSQEIVERLRRIAGQPFAVANPVPHPPDQVVRPPRLILRATAIKPGV